MTAKQSLSRRAVFQRGLTALVSLTGASLLSACGQQSPPAATQAPASAKPTSAPPAPKPAATSGGATSAGAAATPAPAAKPVAQATSESRIGANLIGKLEGPSVVTDAAQFPRSFKEAPQLAELVKQGTLPPVADRIGQDPLVVKPVKEIGKYGGTWRRGFTGPGDKWNGYRAGTGPDHVLFWDYTGNTIVPNIARAWKFDDGGKTLVLSLRRGMKWSDGHPFTADDFVFWFEDLYSNKELLPSGDASMRINGKPGKVEKVDDATVRYTFPEPYYLLADMLAGATPLGSQSQYGLNFMGSFAPAHYLKQFHTKYTPKEKIDEAVKAAGFDNWVNLMKFKNDWALNPELPVLTPWKTVQAINNTVWELERNPYSIWVDTDGNQLPYIDKIQLTLAENLEVANLRAIAGEYDEMGRHMDATKLPVFLENQQKGNYKVVLDTQTDAAAAAIHVNQSFDADPEIRKWLTNVDFRRALSMGIDRDQLNEAFFLGLAVPSSLMSDDASPENAGPEWRLKWSKLDVAQANQLLDKIGLTKKDPNGMRLRTDNGQVLRLEVITVAAAFLPFAQMMEMVAQQWKKIGVQLDIKDTERSLADRTAKTNAHQLYVWGGGNADIFMWPRHDMPAEPNEPFSGTLYATWYASGGTAGKKPEDPELLKAYDMLRKGSSLETAERNKLGQELKKVIVDQQWVIGTCGFFPYVRVISNKMGNVPDRYSWVTRARTPGAALPPTYYFKS